MADTAPAQPPQLNGSYRPGATLPGPAEFDQDLYGQDDRFAAYQNSIAVDGGDDVDEDRDRTLAG